ncbi:galactokinase [Nesterenkonia alba]|uniref:galactokinase n=1 Tax=Nesterenkonia alba TaxID=515814 RepID=UPI0003B49B2C|nr:galactokinase [Nesterenkonia alba]
MPTVDITALKQTFTELYGRDPHGVWAAPGRVNLIGEHTDYQGGFVMPFALPHATYAVAARRDDGVIRVHSANNGETHQAEVAALHPQSVQGWPAYVLGMFWSLKQTGYEVSGADLVIETAVPQGAGLSSSAALECSTGLAVAELNGHDVAPLTLAQIAQRAENDFVGMPCGLMDQMIAMLGREGHVVQFDNRSLEADIVPFNAEGAQILVVDTKAPHRLVDGEYAARHQQCQQAAELLGIGQLRELNDPGAPTLSDVLTRLEDEVLRKRVRHQVTENQRVLETGQALAAGDLVTAGELMSASHASLRDDYEVTVPEVDLAQETLVEAGAYGARITGGGFGGCVIALVRTGDTDRLAAAVQDAYAQAGYTEPGPFVAVPSAGARRIE